MAYNPISRRGSQIILPRGNARVNATPVNGDLAPGEPATGTASIYLNDYSLKTINLTDTSPIVYSSVDRIICDTLLIPSNTFLKVGDQVEVGFTITQNGTASILFSLYGNISIGQNFVASSDYIANPGVYIMNKLNDPNLLTVSLIGRFSVVASDGVKLGIQTLPMGIGESDGVRKAAFVNVVQNEFILSLGLLTSGVPTGGTTSFTVSNRYIKIDRPLKTNYQVPI